MSLQNAELCAVCGEGNIEHQVLTQQFVYAFGERDVLLTADIPVEYCSSCGEYLVGEAGERVRHEAVCRYLGRLSPAEIKKIRQNLDLTQVKFAEALAVGKATVKRWESGLNIQNRSIDLKLRELAGNAVPMSALFTPVFRTTINESTLHKAERFELRPQV